MQIKIKCTTQNLMEFYDWKKNTSSVMMCRCFYYIKNATVQSMLVSNLNFYWYQIYMLCVNRSSALNNLSFRNVNRFVCVNQAWTEWLRMIICNKCFFHTHMNLHKHMDTAHYIYNKKNYTFDVIFHFLTNLHNIPQNKCLLSAF